MITAQEAQALTASKAFQLEDVERGIKMMAADGKNYWCMNGSISAEVRQQLMDAGFKVDRHDGTVQVKW